MAQTQIHGGTQIRTGTITSDRIASGTIADDRLSGSYVYANGSRAFTGDQSMGNHKLTHLSDPTASTDAATKAYVDGLIQGFDWKQSVRVATTATSTLSSGFTAGSTIDGVTLVAGDRILIKDQTNGSENGIYVVNATGSPTRAGDADSNASVTAGLTVFISEGTTNGNSSWSLTSDDDISLGTTALEFTQVAGGALYNAGDGLTLNGSSFSVNAGDTSVTVNADNLQVNVGDASLEVSNGLRVKQGSAGQVYIANNSGVLTPTTLSGDVSAVSGSGAVTLDSNVVKASNYVVRETPSGAVNGSNTSFTLAHTPVSGTEQVFLNGLLQEPGVGNDYTVNGASITMLFAPATNDKIRVTYLK